jgi:hypothetical protein
MISPASSARAETIVSGKRARALQYAPVLVLPGCTPLMTRLTMASLTAR